MAEEPNAKRVKLEETEPSGKDYFVSLIPKRVWRSLQRFYEYFLQRRAKNDMKKPGSDLQMNYCQCRPSHHRSKLQLQPPQVRRNRRKHSLD